MLWLNKHHQRLEQKNPRKCLHASIISTLGTLNKRNLGPFWVSAVAPQLALCCLIFMSCHFGINKLN